MKAKKLGIWMDHEHAYLIEFSVENKEVQAIPHKFTHGSSEKRVTHGEVHLHHKQERHLSEYFKQLADVVREYDDVLLFGPTSAKTELFHSLNENKLYGHVKIRVQDADKMTENQRTAFVRNFFVHHPLLV
jgi:hypothetical protein